MFELFLKTVGSIVDAATYGFRETPTSQLLPKAHECTYPPEVPFDPRQPRFVLKEWVHRERSRKISSFRDQLRQIKRNDVSTDASSLVELFKEITQLLNDDKGPPFKLEQSQAIAELLNSINTLFRDKEDARHRASNVAHISSIMPINASVTPLHTDLGTNSNTTPSLSEGSDAIQIHHIEDIPNNTPPPPPPPPPPPSAPVLVTREIKSPMALLQERKLEFVKHNAVVMKTLQEPYTMELLNELLFNTRLLYRSIAAISAKKAPKQATSMADALSGGMNRLKKSASSKDVASSSSSSSSVVPMTAKERELQALKDSLYGQCADLCVKITKAKIAMKEQDIQLLLQSRQQKVDERMGLERRIAGIENQLREPGYQAYKALISNLTRNEERLEEALSELTAYEQQKQYLADAIETEHRGKPAMKLSEKIVVDKEVFSALVQDNHKEINTCTENIHALKIVINQYRLTLNTSYPQGHSYHDYQALESEVAVLKGSKESVVDSITLNRRQVDAAKSTISSLQSENIRYSRGDLGSDPVGIAGEAKPNQSQGFQIKMEDLANSPLRSNVTFFKGTSARSLLRTCSDSQLTLRK